MAQLLTMRGLISVGRRTTPWKLLLPFPTRTTHAMEGILSCCCYLSSFSISRSDSWAFVSLTWFGQGGEREAAPIRLCLQIWPPIQYAHGLGLLKSIYTSLDETEAVTNASPHVASWSASKLVTCMYFLVTNKSDSNGLTLSVSQICWINPATL